MREPQPDDLLTPSEVAHMFRVDPKTVTRWANTTRDGKPLLPCLRTPGGHRRYRRGDVTAIRGDAAAPSTPTAPPEG